MSVRTPRPSLDTVTARGPVSSAPGDQLAAELALRWRQGERPLAEEFLNRTPELWNQPEAALEVIYEEVCQRQARGERIVTADFVQRFPQWQEQLRVLLACHQLLEPEAAPPADVRESLRDFRLLAELGRGVQGRVYLATQPSLANRPVVVKVVPGHGQEHLTLARLQHTHIMPLYFVQDDPPRNRRVLCMPYVGGASWSQVLDRLRDQPPVQRSGHDILRVLQELQAELPVPVPVAGPACDFFARATYVQAVCWLGFHLAEALQYAQERGLVHLDLKPSNVLLAADGQAMLLDFHLARAPLAAHDPAPAWLGGTPPYMAPEQEAALVAVRAGQPLPGALDGRADSYALGLLLYETLGGTLPLPEGRPAPRLNRCNPRVSLGLADLIAKCLERDPAARYRTAAELAADLRRHLSDLPLRGVANRSLRERLGKWRRRRRYAPALLGLGVLLLAACGGVLSYFIGQREKALQALPKGRLLYQKGYYVEAQGAFSRGLAVAEDIPFCQTVVQELKHEFDLAGRAVGAEELHRFVEHARLLFSGDEVASQDLEHLVGLCRGFWARRSYIYDPRGLGPPPQLQGQARVDLLDVAIFYADLRVRTVGPALKKRAHELALNVLAEAEELYGPSSALYLERRAHAAALGQQEEAEQAARKAAETSPRTHWEFYAAGRSLLQAGDTAAALEQFERALSLKPDSFWANFSKGRAAYQLDRFQDALLAFQACVVLAPEQAWCFHNRAVVYGQLGELEQAIRDEGKALDLEPLLVPAALHRGQLLRRARRYDEALKDLAQALRPDAAPGGDPAAVYYERALLYRDLGRQPAAVQDLEEVLKYNPQHKEARALLARLQQKSS